MDRFTVVLARPAGPGNVGSISRLCANFGCKRLRIVSPCFDFHAALNEGLNSEMGWYSRHQGLQILEECTVVHDDMGSALAGCTRVVGFSRRRGRNRDAGVSHQVRGESLRGCLPSKSDPGQIHMLLGNKISKCYRFTPVVRTCVIDVVMIGDFLTLIIIVIIVTVMKCVCYSIRWTSDPCIRTRRTTAASPCFSGTKQTA